MYKFCPKCAGDLKMEGEGPDRFPVCQKCRFVFYQNSKPCTGAIILDKGNKVMIARRANNPHKDKWDLVGGFLSDGEDPIDGTKREILEELGVDCSVGDFVAIVVDNYGLAEDDFNTINIFYEVRLSSHKFTTNDEIAELKWFAKDEIPWDELAFNNTTLALTAYYKLN